ncbi:MAG TPA: NAD(P)H-dependent oxidoreductase [Armatimonadota bacterium]|jgi:NAD(P)H-dependent FMN reductase
MANVPRILAFAGSARLESLNKKLARAAALSVQAEGAEVTFLDLREYPLPLYDGDLEREQGLPANGRALKDLFLAHQGLLIVSPEYNSSISPLLKNTIDWVSRPVEGEPPLACFRDKVAALLSASPGALGGLRGLVHLRSILGNIGVVVLPTQVALTRAGDAFDAEGHLVDEGQRDAVESLARRLVDITARMM